MHNDRNEGGERWSDAKRKMRRKGLIMTRRGQRQGELAKHGLWGRDIVMNKAEGE